MRIKFTLSSGHLENPEISGLSPLIGLPVGTRNNNVLMLTNVSPNTSISPNVRKGPLGLLLRVYLVSRITRQELRML